MDIESIPFSQDPWVRNTEVNKDYRSRSSLPKVTKINPERDICISLGFEVYLMDINQIPPQAKFSSKLFYLRTIREKRFPMSLSKPRWD
jgi:hypothetical protein